MSVVTKDTIQPSSGQALTIKDEGGTASITVATNGEATFAENVILTANKGLSFQNHSVTSVTGASSTTSNNILDDYEFCISQNYPKPTIKKFYELFTKLVKKFGH